MKFSQLAIGSILLIEAVLLLYSPQERFNFHSFFGQGTFLCNKVKQHMTDCQCWQQVGYECLQKVRYFAVALIVAGAYSLTLGNNLLVGILAQLLWTVTQSELYYNQGIKEVRNTLVQFLFFVILVSDLIKECRECRKTQLKKKQQQQIEEQRLSKQAEEKSSIKQEGTQQANKKKGGKGEEKESKKSK